MLGENLAHKKFIVFATLFSLDLKTTFEHLTSTVCSRRLDLNHIVNFCTKWVKTSWCVQKVLSNWQSKLTI